MQVRPYSPYHDAEFLKSMNVVPFDPEQERLAEHNRQFEALVMFNRAQEREEAIKTFRGILFGLAFSICGLLIVFLACCPWFRGGR